MYRTYISERGVERRGSPHRALGGERRAQAQRGSRAQRVRLSSRRAAGRRGGGTPAAHRQAMLEFAMKFQQVTAPVTAKGVEDTAFYRYNRLVCLNEVGGDPRRFSASSARRASGQSRARAALAGCDARDVHSRHQAQRGCARAHRGAERVAGLNGNGISRAGCGSIAASAVSSRRRPAPDREDEYLLYQTLVGVWSAGIDAAGAVDRALAGLCDQGGARGEACHVVGQPERGLRAGAERLHRATAGSARSAMRSCATSSRFARTVACFGRLNSLARSS